MSFYYVADVSLTQGAAIPTFFQCTRKKKKGKWEIERRRNETVRGSENPISTIFHYKFLIN